MIASMRDWRDLQSPDRQITRFPVDPIPRCPTPRKLFDVLVCARISCLGIFTFLVDQSWRNETYAYELAAVCFAGDLGLGTSHPEYPAATAGPISGGQRGQTGGACRY